MNQHGYNVKLTTDEINDIITALSTRATELTDIWQQAHDMQRQNEADRLLDKINRYRALADKIPDEAQWQ